MIDVIIFYGILKSLSDAEDGQANIGLPVKIIDHDLHFSAGFDVISLHCEI